MRPPPRAKASPAPPPSVPTERMLLDVPENYDLVSLVEGAQLPPLPPLVFDGQQAALQVVLYGEKSPVEVLIHQIRTEQVRSGVPLLVYGLPEGSPGEPLLEQLGWVLGLNEDLSFFYALSDQDEALAWARARDAARCLRAPTVFEDLVKCLLYVNVPGSMLMPFFQALCRGFGARTNLSRAAFPTAAALAAAPSAVYERELGATFCKPVLLRSLRRLAERCASGALYPESLRRPPRRFDKLLLDEQLFGDVIEEEVECQFRIERLLSSLPGFGPRARDLMLPLLGCYELPALDMATVRRWRQRFASPRRQKRPLRHRDLEWQRAISGIERRVAPYSVYGGLAQRLLLREPAGAAVVINK